MIPFRGPRRCATALGPPDPTLADPVGFLPNVHVSNSIYGIGAVDIRANALGTTSLIDEAALDPYIFVRGAYLQRREYMVYDGNPPPEKDE